MFSAFQTFGKLGALASSVARAWTPLALWPNGASSPGLWIDPAYTAASFQNSTGSTPLSAIGTVADSANPVGLVLDRKGGATVLADPGIHLLQATSTARPFASARVNLLTKTEDFSDAVWGKYEVTVDPDKHTVKESANTTAHVLYKTGVLIPSVDANTQVSVRVVVAALGRDFVTVCVTSGAPSSYSSVTASLSANSITQQLATGWNIASASVVDGAGAEAGYKVISMRISPATALQFCGTDICPSDTATFTPDAYGRKIYSGDITKGVVVLNSSVSYSAAAYQRVNTDSDYDGAFPVYDKFDGTDDNLASATFAAGTLTAGMDCLIAVRRDSAETGILLYETPGVGGRYFGVFAPGDSAPCVGADAGTPTVWVDNVQLNGGTAVTRDTLATALTPGGWHIAEFRGLDLDVWINVATGGFPSWPIKGAIGGIMLFASGQDANRDKARAHMAAYFGVTLA